MIVLDSTTNTEQAAFRERLDPNHENPTLNGEHAREIIRVICRNAQSTELDLAGNER